MVGEDRADNPQPSPVRVIKISEMMLRVDDRYLGEIGNPSHRNQPMRFHYDPGIGMDIVGQGKKNYASVGLEDVVKLSENFGHVTVRRVFGNREADYLDTQIYEPIGAIERDITDKMHLVSELAEVAGVDLRELDIEDRAIKMAGSKNKVYSPEEFLDCYLKVVDEELKEKGKPPIAYQVKATGIIQSELTAIRESIVRYFYLYAELSGLPNETTPQKLTILEKFPAIGKDCLIEEYKNRPDLRFGDDLLVAISQHLSKQEQKEPL